MKQQTPRTCYGITFVSRRDGERATLHESTNTKAPFWVFEYDKKVIIDSFFWASGGGFRTFEEAVAHHIKKEISDAQAKLAEFSRFAELLQKEGDDV